MPNSGHKATTQRQKQIPNSVNKSFRAVITLLQLLMRWLRRVFGGLFSSRQLVQRRDKVLVAILLLIWVAILLGNFFFRASDIFEGNLLVQEMSFTYTGEQKKLFLKNISNIKNLDLQGSQPQPLILTGKFSSNEPTLNQKLSQRRQLTIELPYATSRFILKPANSSQTSELNILELRIHPNSQLNQLSYTSQPSQLSFCIQSATVKPETCLFPENLVDNPTQSKSVTIGSIKLTLGQQPLTVSLGMFNLPELNIKSDINSPQELNFQFVPQAIDERLLTIASPTRFFITLPNLPKTVNSQAANSSQWLRGDIAVKDVRFTRFDITDNVTDELKTSTILSGEVRMGKDVMKLQANQFLVLSDKQAIKKLRYIEINPQPPQGLQTLIFGKSKGIAVGLYPEFPVQRIEPTWLSKHLSQEAVNALLAFIAAFTGVLLPRLFPEPPKNTLPEPPQNPLPQPPQNPTSPQNTNPN